MTETYQQMIARKLKEKNSPTKDTVQPVQQPAEPAPVAPAPVAPAPITPAPVAQTAPAPVVQQAPIQQQVAPEPVTEQPVEEPQEVPTQEDIAMQIELLQNEGRFRAELLYLLNQINTSIQNVFNEQK